MDTDTDHEHRTQPPGRNLVADVDTQHEHRTRTQTTDIAHELQGQIVHNKTKHHRAPKLIQCAWFSFACVLKHALALTSHLLQKIFSVWTPPPKSNITCLAPPTSGRGHGGSAEFVFAQPLGIYLFEMLERADEPGEAYRAQASSVSAGMEHK